MKMNTKKLTTLAMLTAMAFVVTLICHFIMPPIIEMPPLKLDLKDTIIVMAGFMMGPVEALLITVVVAFIEMITISTTGFWGFLMNALASAAFACPAAFLYRRVHSKSGAFISLLVGVVLMTGIMVLWNWLITPIYSGWPRSQVVPLLATAFLPFNAVKGAVNMALTMLMYKPLVTTLRKSRLLPPSESASGRSRGGMMIAGAVLLASCVLVILVMTGVL